VPERTPAAPPDASGSHRHYAGFWARAAARAIDIFIILIAYNVFYLADRLGADAGLWSGPALGNSDGGGRFSAENFVRGVFFLGFPILYYVYLTGSTGQTFGKMALRIRVVNEDGSPLDYRKAMLRWLSYFVCDLTLNIGYIWAAFDARKQGLHDKLCRTVVVRVGDPAHGAPQAPPEPDRAAGPPAAPNGTASLPPAPGVPPACSPPPEPPPPGPASQPDPVR